MNAKLTICRPFKKRNFVEHLFCDTLYNLLETWLNQFSRIIFQQPKNVMENVFTGNLKKGELSCYLMGRRGNQNEKRRHFI